MTSLVLLGAGLAAAVAGATAWALSEGHRRAVRAVSLGGAVVLVGAAALGWVELSGPEPDPELDDALPERTGEGGYVSSQGCRSCHPAEHASWHRTFHRTMTQEARPGVVAAPFDGRILRERGRAFGLEQEGGGYYVYEFDPAESGEPAELDDEEWVPEAESVRRVVMTTGSHHLQAYWLEGADGLLEQLPFVYLIREERWLANEDSFLQPPVPAEEPLRRYMWSDGCALCHTTGGPWGALEVPEGQLPEAAVGELGISCEACHGPAEAHARAQRAPWARYDAHLLGARPTDVVNPAELDAPRAAAVCGRCHAVHPSEGEPPGAMAFRPGDRLEWHLPMDEVAEVAASARTPRQVMALPEGRQQTASAFWANGSVRIAGREYTGMTRSGCFERGQMDCTSCHSMHRGAPSKQLDPELGGDQMCAGCHAELAADPAAHSRHAPGAPGGQCVDCHMPYSSYGLLMSTRSHRLGSPEASGALGRQEPNACNLCHLDRSLRWTASQLQRWYGQPAPELDPAIADVPAGALWTLQGDAAQRAVAAWHFGRPGPQRAARLAPLRPALARLLEDRYAAVRQIAAGALLELDPAAPVDVDEAARRAQPEVHRALLERWGPDPEAPSATTLDMLESRQDTTPITIAE